MLRQTNYERHSTAAYGSGTRKGQEFSSATQPRIECEYVDDRQATMVLAVIVRRGTKSGKTRSHTCSVILDTVLYALR